MRFGQEFNRENEKVRKDSIQFICWWHFSFKSCQKWWKRKAKKFRGKIMQSWWNGKLVSPRQIINPWNVHCRTILIKMKNLNRFLNYSVETLLIGSILITNISTLKMFITSKWYSFIFISRVSWIMIFWVAF